MASPRTETADPHELAERQFREFYREVLRARDRTGEASVGAADVAAGSVARHLSHLLELQALEAHRERSRFEREGLDEARYLKAAMADEILLHTRWIGRDLWTAHLLEASLFHTRIAGDQVFRRIEQLLADQEPSRRPLARLYLLALGAGFQGHQRGGVDTDRLMRWRVELQAFSNQRPTDPAGRDPVLSDQPYRNVLSHLAPRRTRVFSRWSVFFLGVILGLLALSEVLWLWQSWPVRRALSSTSVAGAPDGRASVGPGGRPC